MPTLDLQDFELVAIEDWPASDSRKLLFSVENADGTARDITDDDVAWFLTAKEYESRADAILADGDTGVTVQRDTVVDPTAGEFRIDIAEGTLAGEWGEHVQHVVLDPTDDSRLMWVGDVILSDTGGA